MTDESLTPPLHGLGRLYHGDCLEVMARLSDASTDLILTDLPYGMTANEWDQAIDLDRLWEHWRRLLKPHGAVALHGTGLFHARLVMSNPKWYKYSWIWRKSNATGFLNAKKQPLRVCEQIAVFYPCQCAFNPQFSQGRPYTARASNSSPNYGQRADGFVTESDGRRYPLDIIEIKNAVREKGHTLHPTQKPVELERYLIRTYTDEGMTVLDCCMGSGSTGVAAMLEGRKFVGIERDERFFEIACERIAGAKVHDA